MKSTLLILTLALFIPRPAGANAALERFERLYGAFLSSYWHDTVTINGIHTTALDYTAIWRDSNHPQSLYRQLIRALAEVRPEQLNAGQAEAFWINAYNIGALRLVVDHYPVASIRSFKISWKLYPWSKKAIQVRGRWYTLTAIEKHKLLEVYADPRILFALNCASISCPDQPSRPYVAGELEQQLDANLKRFLANPTKGLRLETSTSGLWLSWIFKKDRNRFKQGDEGLMSFLRPYLDKQTLTRVSEKKLGIHYLPHDWTLNDWTLRNQ